MNALRKILIAIALLLPLPALAVCPGGKQCVTLTSISPTSWVAMEFNPAATPDAAVGDIIEIDLVTTPGGFTATQSVDGNLSYSGDSSRQVLAYTIFDTSAGDYMSGGPGNLVFNNPGPSAPEDSIPAALLKGDAFSIDLCARFPAHPLGDTLTGSNGSGGTGTGTGHHPAATTFGGTGNCTWSGTPTTAATGSFDFTVTDAYGAIASTSVSWEVVDPDVAIPDCATTHVDFFATCLPLLDAALLSQGVITLEFSDTVTVGRVISQNPTGTADLFDPIDFVVSRGVEPDASAIKRELLRHRGGMRVH